MWPEYIKYNFVNLEFFWVARFGPLREMSWICTMPTVYIRHREMLACHWLHYWRGYVWRYTVGHLQSPYVSLWSFFHVTRWCRRCHEDIQWWLQVIYTHKTWISLWPASSHSDLWMCMHGGVPSEVERSVSWELSRALQDWCADSVCGGLVNPIFTSKH